MTRETYATFFAEADLLRDENRVPGVLFLGTDTGVGKTYQAVRLVRHLRARRIKVGVYKPVASGVTGPGQRPGSEPPGQPASDPELLCSAANLDYSILPRVCPQTFLAPLAPPSAAAMQGLTVDATLIRDGFQWWHNQCDFLVVESAGGAMSPISQNMTCLDLAIDFNLPIALVVANRLGCVSHTLLASEAIARRGLVLKAFLLNQPDGLGGKMGSAQGVSWNEDRAATDAMDWHQCAMQSSEQLIRSFLPDIPLLYDAHELIPLLGLD